MWSCTLLAVHVYRCCVDLHPRAYAAAGTVSCVTFEVYTRVVRSAPLTHKHGQRQHGGRAQAVEKYIFQQREAHGHTARNQTEG